MHVLVGFRPYSNHNPRNLALDKIFDAHPMSSNVSLSFKFRYFNFKLLLVPFFSHLVVAVVYCSLMVSMPIAKVPTMQEFKPGMPLTKIDACVLKNNEQFFYGIYYSYHQWFSIITQTLHFTALPIFIHFICTILII